MVLFSDGFETGDFTAWTANVGGAISSVKAHHGTYSDYFTGVLGYTSKTLGSAVSEIYMRTYLWLVSTPALNDDFRVMYNDVPRLSIRIINSGGSILWEVQYTNSAFASIVEIAATGPTIGQWMCVEFWWKANTLNGVKLWQDGNLVHTIAGTTVNVTLATWRIAGYALVGGNPTLYHDCVVMDSARIGCEVAGIAKRKIYYPETRHLNQQERSRSRTVKFQATNPFLEGCPRMHPRSF